VKSNAKGIRGAAEYLCRLIVAELFPHDKLDGFTVASGEPLNGRTQDLNHGLFFVVRLSYGMLEHETRTKSRSTQSSSMVSGHESPCDSIEP
jgi:hypothetical protein